jgi:hypothetical protein
MTLKNFTILACAFLIGFVSKTFSQSNNANDYRENVGNYVQSAVPFLTIAPDSRGGAMGDAGVATAPDVYSMHWNPAKFVFLEKPAGIAVSYSPWLRKLTNDMSVSYLTGYYHLTNDQVVASSLRFFSLGQIDYANIQGESTGTGNPTEFAFDAAYARLFGPKVSGALAFRYIRSNLSSNQKVDGIETNPGQSFAVDIATYYNTDIKLSDKNGKLAFGLDISNICNKISYTSDEKKEPIPTNMRLGGALTVDLDNFNSLSLTTDFNKLLVPTPPIYWQNSQNADSVGPDGNKVIKYGKDPNVGVVTGIFQSFTDAPGIQSDGSRNVLKQELQEVTYSIGMEYWYRKQFAIRGGYYHESPFVGNRTFFTMGLGLRFNVFGFDFSYLITNANNPLANTLRFSISLEFDAIGKKKGA